jgi:hypothetical protein
MEGAIRDELVELSLARFTFGQWLIAHFLKYFKKFTALFTLIFIDWHTATPLIQIVHY